MQIDMYKDDLIAGIRQYHERIDAADLAREMAGEAAMDELANRTAHYNDMVLKVCNRLANIVDYLERISTPNDEQAKLLNDAVYAEVRAVSPYEAVGHAVRLVDTQKIDDIFERAKALKVPG